MDIDRTAGILPSLYSFEIFDSFSLRSMHALTAACTLSLSSVQNLSKKGGGKSKRTKREATSYGNNDDDVMKEEARRRRDRVALTIFVIHYTCAFENDSKCVKHKNGKGTETEGGET